jgi:hypothetical protein
VGTQTKTKTRTKRRSVEEIEDKFQKTHEPEGSLIKSDYADIMSEEEAKIHRRLDKIIDIKKPLLPQVEKLTNREFLAFVRRPRHIEDTDGIQLWEDPLYDKSRKIHFTKTLRVLIPLIMCWGFLGFYCAETWSEGIWNHIIYSWLLGLISCWTFTEYFFHRFLLHRELNLDLDAPADGKHNAAIFS